MSFSDSLLLAQQIGSYPPQQDALGSLACPRAYPQFHKLLSLRDTTCQYNLVGGEKLSENQQESEGVNFVIWGVHSNTVDLDLSQNPLQAEALPTRTVHIYK